MEIIVFESDAYRRMQQEMLGLIRQAVREAKQEALQQASPENDWLTGEEAKQLLGIKSKTKLQALRDTDAIIFSQHGRIIKYSKKSILAFLNRHIPNS
ncbi:helix-turn-helix domain-containing protein [Tunicatimonas pelagia]|uniref:helix-turn-helix domain-containing protein n=1 Tax=Tunicatimonas pelagia TaxID=931531 RepID=UPI0026659F70|nr:helix-turn-helix domain-containing protein [Tunicatimonas pelagia]WKN44892.1 helix-turn-helix domain-containing protein [Tunicatimonas pelagia]